MTCRRLSLSLLPALLLAGCATQPDLAPVKQARSLAAEWSKINQLDAAGALTATYASEMRREVREQLSTTASTFADPASPQAREVERMLALPPDAPPARIAPSLEALKHIEDSLESA